MQYFRKKNHHFKYLSTQRSFNMSAAFTSVGGVISVFPSPLSRFAEPLRSPNLSLTSVSVVFLVRLLKIVQHNYPGALLV